jgi:hypothetical protein
MSRKFLWGNESAGIESPKKRVKSRVKSVIIKSVGKNYRYNAYLHKNHIEKRKDNGV